MHQDLCTILEAFIITIIIIDIFAITITFIIIIVIVIVSIIIFIIFTIIILLLLVTIIVNNPLVACDANELNPWLNPSANQCTKASSESCCVKRLYVIKSDWFNFPFILRSVSNAVLQSCRASSTVAQLRLDLVSDTEFESN